MIFFSTCSWHTYNNNNFINIRNKIKLIQDTLIFYNEILLRMWTRLEKKSFNLSSETKPVKSVPRRIEKKRKEKKRKRNKERK